MRKILSVMLSLILLLTMAVPAFATANDVETTDTRTVEEILNEYHEKSFAAEMEKETGNPSRNSRQASSGKSLEEETVDELRAAGYEAYHVTSSNYEALEESLKTDFEDLGLEQAGSYIITICGETSSGTRGMDPPTEDFFDGGGSVIQYNYNGNTYYLRHITVTETTGSYMQKNSITRLGPNFWAEHLVLDVFCTYLMAKVDEYSGKVPLGTIISLLGGSLNTGNYTLLDDNELVCMANTSWIANCIQIWVSEQDIWDTSQCSAYAVSQAYFTGFLYNEDTGISERFSGNTQSATFYSPLYSNLTQRRNNAVAYYLLGRNSYDFTGDIEFYLGNNNYDIVYTSTGSPFFSHVEEWVVPSYSTP